MKKKLSQKHSITIAASAGFCPGVKRAIEKVTALACANKIPVYTLGPLIHNNQVIAKLRKLGIKSAESIKRIKPPAAIVIRAHGITPELETSLRNSGFTVIDATCPLVKRVHAVVKKYADKGFTTVIVGDSGHAEVAGIVGYAYGNSIVVADAKQAGKIKKLGKVNVVAQTTQDEENFLRTAAVIRKKSGFCVISNTICTPTKDRQKETVRLAKKASLMIIVGGKHSANTTRLTKLCSEICPAVIHVETARELKKSVLSGHRKIVITAGASTPEWEIAEVAKKAASLCLNP